MIKPKTGCRRCGGSLIRDGDEVKCVACGCLATTLMDMKRYYEQNKEDILQDIKEIGPRAARKKWQIPAGTFSGLKKRWKVVQAVEQLPPGEAEPLKPAQHLLPPLPNFNDNWPESVQTKWLDIWMILITKGHLKILEESEP